MGMKTVAIIGALDEEVALIAKSLTHVTHTAKGSLDIVSGTVDSFGSDVIKVAATVGGMGLVNAAATTQLLIDEIAPDAVIFSGIAGNLNTHLHINDVVLGGTLRYLDTDMRLVGQWKPGTADAPVEEFHSDDRLLEVADEALANAGITHITGIIASGNYFVDTPQKVEEVIRLTGADAVEMEGSAVAQVAARNNVPALVIRALSDNADTDYEVFKEFDISEYADTAARLAVDIVKRL
ncbi:5'-methylthioadenosine/S-adenosylhomocysteine nucleosidase [Bifidobacterium longum]|uniref:5'-methylthioadenosine/S-adenosylhomocysteine nucleosidase n=1 Tax=Bifidobacterium longum TaxID=216816 RepID=UPI00103A2CD9|nr:5'-methylthioadenosine/S-adenosylhomocysteine nucleosidase [Bifidobacterium longum]TCE52783.1 5'-methylthioadenosine nucleosidase/S-adenosylhomocysteine nucleosidase [Bifidobacterium longum subsp. longum]TCE76811.1 5'-methylthioadenosine nucleosidase/S-adenosylhomocysteine nucleosidase [Bifidobacterium longum subsp. longum]